MHRQMVRSPAFWALLVSGSISGSLVLANWWAVSPYGNEVVLFLAPFALLPAIVCLLAIPIALVCMLIPAARRASAAILVFALACVAVAFCCARMGEAVRMHAFGGLAERSRPLITAIKAFERDHGIPPPSLDALVPGYLPKVPTTGMRAYPDYVYSVGGDPVRRARNDWTLVVHASSGWINFDQFMYFPRQDYPQKGYGGWLQRVGDWAYVHE